MRFSLESLIAMFAALLVGLAASELSAQEPTPLDVAIDRLEAAGATVIRDEKRPGNPVTSVWFFRTFDRDSIKEIEKIPTIKELRIGQSGLQDEDFAAFAGLAELTSLEIGDVEITSAGLAHFAKSPRLESISIKNSPVADLSVLPFATLAELKEVRLDGVPITDEGLRPLIESKSIEGISIVSNQVSDRSLDLLQRLPRLRWLDIRSTRITADAIANFREAAPHVILRTGRRRPTVQPAIDYHAREVAIAGSVVLGLGIVMALAIRSPNRRRALVWKLPLVSAAILFTIAYMLSLAARRPPLIDGDPVDFWFAACQVDVGDEGDPRHWLSAEVHDNWFVYNFVGFCGNCGWGSYHRVSPDAAAILLPKVVRALESAPPGVLHPDVENGYRAWKNENPACDNPKLLFEKIEAARIARRRAEDPESLHIFGTDDGDQWRRANRFAETIAFEAIYFSLVILFVAWPWLVCARWQRFAIHLCFLPMLVFLPYWLGYAAFTYRSGDTGGVLYPRLIAGFRGDYWTFVDAAVIDRLPPLLERFSQMPLATGYFREERAVPRDGLGPTIVLLIALCSVLFTRWMDRRFRWVCDWLKPEWEAWIKGPRHRSPSAPR